MRNNLIVLLLLFSTAHAEGVKTPYTEATQSLIAQNSTNAPEFSLKCWTTPGNDFYIGVEQRVRMHASIGEVAKVVRAVDQYDQLFPGYKKIALVSQKENHSTVSFEQIVPIIFVPNVKYEMLYTELNPSPDKIVFWYRLKDAGTLKASDGLVILNKAGDHDTDYTEYDFFDAEWGLAKVEGAPKLWKDAVKGIYWSDLSMKLKAEKPEMFSKDALSAAKQALDMKLIDDCVHDRTEWKLPALK